MRIRIRSARFVGGRQSTDPIFPSYVLTHDFPTDLTRRAWDWSVKTGVRLQTASLFPVFAIYQLILFVAWNLVSHSERGKWDSILLTAANIIVALFSLGFFFLSHRGCLSLPAANNFMVNTYVLMHANYLEYCKLLLHLLSLFFFFFLL